MTIGNIDFELGLKGQAHQKVLNHMHKEGPIAYMQLKKFYNTVNGDRECPFDRALENLKPYIESKSIGSTTYYRIKPRWLSSREVAERIGVSIRTVQAWYEQGNLPARKLRGRLRFSAEDVEALSLEETPTAIHGVEDPVLTDLWDNDADAAYDKL